MGWLFAKLSRSRRTEHASNNARYGCRFSVRRLSCTSALFLPFIEYFLISHFLLLLPRQEGTHETQASRNSGQNSLTKEILRCLSKLHCKQATILSRFVQGISVRQPERDRPEGHLPVWPTNQGNIGETRPSSCGGAVCNAYYGWRSSCRAGFGLRAFQIFLNMYICILHL